MTIAGQLLTATPSDGEWSVTSAILANGTYPVAASVSDGAGNPGSATQQLIVDTVLPVVTIDDGPSVTTNDPTPTITGTSDAVQGTVVRVTIGGLTRTALVQSEGTWNVTPSALTDGTRTVSASVTDPAGNEGTASQELIIDTQAPAVTITGGANALTNDPTPQISGTANVASGTTVTVDLADETLTGLVQSDGTWSVSAADLFDGSHRVVMTVSDAAGNPARLTQSLTVDTVAPVVAINGGANATTNDLTPTIAGTSNAAPGTTVTVSIAGQSKTTLLQADGTWNATPSALGAGVWSVVASALDPAGNTGSDTQTLTIATAAAVISGGPAPTTGPAPAVTPVPEATPVVRPAPAPAGGGPVNAVATTTVARNPRQKVKGAVLSIRTKVRAPAKGAVSVTATGTVKIKGVKKTIRLTSATVRVPAGQSRTVKLKQKGGNKAVKAAFKKIKRAVNQGKNVTARITLKIVDAAANKRSVKRMVRLTK